MPVSQQIGILTDGTMSFDAGVNSIKTTSIASQLNPNGLARNELAWLDNATVRTGAISARPAWVQSGGNFPVAGDYQGSKVYQPRDDTAPYMMGIIGGHLWKWFVDAPESATDLSAQFGLTMPVTERCFFCQAEEFMVIQAGDSTTLPLFWDDTTLRRSTGDSRKVGVTSGAIVSPAIGAFVSIPLASPYYTGAVNQTFQLNGDSTKLYIQVIPGNFLTLKNTGGAVPGSTVTAGTELVGTADTVVGRFLVSFVVPALNATVAVFITPQYPGAVLDTVTIFDQPWQVTVIGHANPALHNIFAVNINDPAGTNYPAPVRLQSVKEITPATCMCYYMGRLWYAQGRTYSAGDIVGSQASGTLFYGFRDSVLKVTENPLCLGGDGFTVPSNAGNIRGIAFAANINTQLGQGVLYIGTREQIYQLQVPIDRSMWTASGTDNAPLQTVALISNGWVNDRSIVSVNGDLFFQSLEPSIRSLQASIRNSGQWGNVPISVEETRILQFNDRALMRFSSGIYFDNRMLQAISPFVCPVGVAHKTIAPLNFDVVSTLKERLPPAWEGAWEGLNWLELFQADFGGRQRAFATIWSDKEQAIQFWELTTNGLFDNNANRITWYCEFPSLTFGQELDLKKLVSGELWIDQLVGEAIFVVQYRPDGSACWFPWTQFKECSANHDDAIIQAMRIEGTNYPGSCPSYKQTISLPRPAVDCATVMSRPSNIGFQFQVKVTVHGSCRIRGMFTHAEPVDRKLYLGLPC